MQRVSTQGRQDAGAFREENRMFDRVLIANRGEIAVRIIRACQEMGIRTVAVYSEADAQALHTTLADEAVLIGPPAPGQSYLRAHTIIQAAVERGCQAIHPGYGFLSENADFAAAVRRAGLVFIGPTPEAMAAMGSKTAARAAMAAAGVPMVPGFQESTADADLIEAGEALGFPLLVKAAAGGGGKGMRIVPRPQDLADALQSARREAHNAFGDDRIYLEKYLAAPRHVEFQVLGDHHGQVIHLFERECSVQRRHQKIIEETPSPCLTPALRAAMAAAAVQAARAVNYTNAGTIEFLVDQERNFYFLEMNTRLQVEHPITEAVTGVDLVKAQLRVAAGEPLPFSQAQISQRGHAIECRIYAEDPANQFLPSIGRILTAVEPVGPGVRVDAGISTGSQVMLHYDPMLAKLIVWDEDRAAALGKMAWALEHYIVLGVTTNIPFLLAVIRHPVFQAGEATTHFVEEHFSDWQPAADPLPDEALIAAALSDFLEGQALAGAPAPTGDPFDPYNPWRQADHFRLGHGR